MAKKSTTFKEVVKILSNKQKISKKEAENFLEVFFEEIKQELLKGNKVQLKDFGTFSTTTWKASEVYSIKKGEKQKMQIKTISFKPSIKIKDKIKSSQ
ncbi:MAG: DNA-binding protein HU [candidate division WS2 bacterium ADurb.Bin280]|uniref:DNA-binding protein HU n=1 Tax=candidate division WS2 bacterium ADurb.Bin280 TaxID=1852829 RepID=A0A1V5SDP6_9BACT|nr:MAG: DNA-binding protein HU [candidate division WS2 bacterium ADurb.Bin280]